jgi:hypothetical protein
MEAAKRALSSRGKRLHTHEMHVRRTNNGGFIARHDLRDRNGQPPNDGQSDSAEYGLADQAALAEHIGQHFGPPEAEPEEPQE